MKILIVEDEARIVSFLEKGLRAHGYTTEHASTGTEALERAGLAEYALFVLDLGLPGMDGLEVLKRLRERGDRTPVIILTARGTVDERVLGLELGADDYLAKPFAFEELLARIRVQLRERLASGATKLQAGGVSLDLQTRRVRVGAEEIELTAREFSLLEVFLRHPGQVLSREQLLSRVWNYDFDPGTNIVDVYVGYLRRKIGGEVLQTVRGAGYRLADRSR